MARSDGRTLDELRAVTITRHYMQHAEGSCLIEVGNTKVICTASVEETVPSFLRGKGVGWVTAEYGMLPRSCKTRVQREATKGRLGGRTQEIQRLIGRSMRSVTDTAKLGERTVILDCDVVQADGGTRCASITGSFVALALALEHIHKEGKVGAVPLADHVAAISVGMLGGKAALDLDYGEDSTAEVDMNIVMTGDGRFVEVQGTAEREPFKKSEMDTLLKLASSGIEELIRCQRKALKGIVSI